MLTRLKEIAYDTVAKKFVTRDDHGRKIEVPLGGGSDPKVGATTEFTYGSINFNSYESAQSFPVIQETSPYAINGPVLIQAGDGGEDNQAKVLFPGLYGIRIDFAANGLPDAPTFQIRFQTNWWGTVGNLLLGGPGQDAKEFNAILPFFSAGDSFGFKMGLAVDYPDELYFTDAYITYLGSLGSDANVKH